MLKVDNCQRAKEVEMEIIITMLMIEILVENWLNVC